MGRKRITTRERLSQRINLHKEKREGVQRKEDEVQCKKKEKGTRGRWAGARRRRLTPQKEMGEMMRRKE